MRNRRSLRPLFEACESRQHMAVDLIATSISCDDPLMPIMYHPQDYSVTVVNNGTSSVPASRGVVVTLYTVDNLNDPTPTYLGAQTVWGWSAFGIKTLSFRVGAHYRADNEGFVFAEIDSQNAVAESNEANNVQKQLGVDTLRYSMEADVSAPAGNVNARPLNMNGQFQDGYIGDESMAGNDIDTYAAPLVGGKTYWFEMYELAGDAGNPSGFNGAMRLFDQNLNLITTSLSDALVHGDRGAYIEFTAPSTGTYYLAISTEVGQNNSITTIADRFAYNEHGPFKLAAAEKDYSTLVISSLDPAAVEGSPSDASSGLEFKITRNWGNQWWRPLTVNLESYGQFNGDLADAIPTMLTILPNQPSVTFRTMPVQDTVNEATETQFVVIAPSYGSYVVDSQYNTQTLMIYDNPATHRPFATASSYVSLDRSGPRTVIQFNEDVGYSISADDYVLRNLDTNAVVPVSKYTVLWSPTINASIVYFTGYANGQLPDGHYRMTLNRNSVYTWPQGRQLEADVNVDFVSLNGDTNADNKVDFSDLLKLAKNYNKDFGWDGGAQYGDFDRDGNVGFDDLLTLARNYGRQMAVAEAADKPTANSRRQDGLFASEEPIA